MHAFLNCLATSLDSHLSHFSIGRSSKNGKNNLNFGYKTKLTVRKCSKIIHRDKDTDLQLSLLHLKFRFGKKAVKSEDFVEFFLFSFAEITIIFLSFHRRYIKQYLAEALISNLFCFFPTVFLVSWYIPATFRRFSRLV